MCLVFIVGIYWFEMENYPLEDDDFSEIFITQTPQAEKVFDVNNRILSEGNDFKSPLVSLVPVGQGQYSDILEDEFEISSSQVDKRYVNHWY